MRESSSMSHSAGSLVLGGRRNGEPSDGNGALERHMLPYATCLMHTRNSVRVREGKSWGELRRRAEEKRTGLAVDRRVGVSLVLNFRGRSATGTRRCRTLGSMRGS